MYSRLAACFVFLKLFSVVATAPLESTTVNAVRPEATDCDNENSDLYDQRQNGTENYRIHVNGVVVLVAPAEAVLQAAQLGAMQAGLESDISNMTTQHLKPKPKPPTATDKVPNDGHGIDTATVQYPKDSKDKNNMKLLNLLHMFRSIRQHDDHIRDRKE